MCTVTYLKSNSGFILTSSRDEKTYRMTAPPQWYTIGNQKLLYPKDMKAGGTWIAQSEENHSICLLNGAFSSHVKKPSYSKSRGKVVLELFDKGKPEDLWQKIDLLGVEPFTILSIKETSFFEFRWDETKKYCKEIDANAPQIWSSATLYDLETTKEREAWFDTWLKNIPQVEPSKLFDFHTAKHSENELKNVVLKRPDGIETISITQIINHLSEPKMIYRDFVADFEVAVPLSKYLVSNSGRS
jgi:hypothetical protein